MSFDATMKKLFGGDSVVFLVFLEDDLEDIDKEMVEIQWTKPSIDEDYLVWREHEELNSRLPWYLRLFFTCTLCGEKFFFYKNSVVHMAAHMYGPPKDLDSDSEEEIKEKEEEIESPVKNCILWNLLKYSTFEHWGDLGGNWANYEVAVKINSKLFLDFKVTQKPGFELQTEGGVLNRTLQIVCEGALKWTTLLS